ncbi:hypothetical protein [Rhodococcus sp. PML026]|uniref:hypothetical protein n=1 Tax=Rhodococcus sp. PML026 TaxID=1356405 RepID=UPI00061EE593|nr:hypothetical protein [Rhodococcus sp. PML026]KJV03304.1 hypothetical protein VF34_01293 [Rhodococcus sp. PML026]
MESVWDYTRADSLVWQLPMYSSTVVPQNNPGFDPPAAWVRALDAVARDLECLRVGRQVSMHSLVWEFEINPDYCVIIGWSGGGFYGFGRGDGMSMDADYPDAVEWVAETVQTELAGYEFVQWPSRGKHLLHPHGAQWVDPQDNAVVADIGSLCST